jgi:hypothetical protein
MTSRVALIVPRGAKADISTRQHREQTESRQRTGRAGSILNTAELGKAILTTGLNHTSDVGVDDDVQVGLVHGRAKVVRPGARTRTVVRRDRKPCHTNLVSRRHIGIVRKVIRHFLSKLNDPIIRGNGEGGDGDAQGAISAVIGSDPLSVDVVAVGRNNGVLNLVHENSEYASHEADQTNLLEVREQVVPRPTGITGQVGPTIEVILATAVPDKEL